MHKHSGAQGPLSAPIWTAHRVRTPSVPMTLLSSQGLVAQMLSSVLPAILTARDRCNYQHALEQP